MKSELINMTQAWDKKLYVPRQESESMTCWKLKNSPSLFTYHTHDDFDSANPSSVQDASHMNSVKKPCSPRVLVAHLVFRTSWVQFLSGLRFFFVPCSCHVSSSLFKITNMYLEINEYAVKEFSAEHNKI